LPPLTHPTHLARAGASFTNTSAGFGDGCVAWNTGGPAPGQNLILYRCGNGTDWQGRFDAPLAQDTPGLFQALSSSFPTGFCVSGQPQWNPALFQLQFHASWSLKDF